MSKKKNKKKDTVQSDITFLDAIKSQRGSWNGVNPVTKVIPDKTKYSRKKKYKTDYREDQ